MVWLSCCKFVHCYFLYHLVLNCKQKEIPRKRIRKPTVSFIDVNREFATSQSRSSESASGIGSDHDDNSTSDADDEAEEACEDERKGEGGISGVVVASEIVASMVVS